MSNKLSPGDRVSVDAGLGITKTGNVQRITESTVFVKHYNGAVVGYRTQHVTKMISEQAAVKPRGVGLKSEFDAFMQVMEKTLTPAELKKREEVAKAMERENPGMDMSKKMAIATATAKKVAEETVEEAKAHTVPKTAKEKSLAAIAEPKDKITHADVLTGRGVKREGAMDMLKRVGSKVLDTLGHGDDEQMRKDLQKKMGIPQTGKPGMATQKEEVDQSAYKKIEQQKSTLDAQIDAAEDRGDDKQVANLRKQYAALVAKSKALRSSMKEDVHYCAKHVFSERFGEGMVVEGQHAEPNEQGLIEWYDVDFGGTVRRVMTEKVKVMHAEYHMNHKKKMKEEDEIEEASQQASSTMKHVQDPTPGEKKAAKDIKPGIAGYRDRIAMLKSAQADGRLKEGKAHTVPKTDKEKDLAAIAPPHDKITHADVLTGRGVKKEEADLEEATENLPGSRTHIMNKDVRHPEHGIISNGTVLRHTGGSNFEVRAGRAKGKIVNIPKEHVNKLDEEVEQIDEASGPVTVHHSADEVHSVLKKHGMKLASHYYKGDGGIKKSMLRDVQIDNAKIGGDRSSIVVQGHHSSSDVKKLDKEFPNHSHAVSRHIKKGEFAAGEDQTIITRTKKSTKDLHEAMISYSDFQSKIDSHRKAGNQIKDDKYDKKKASYTVVDQEGTAKKITHTDAGVSQQHLGSMKRDDSDDKSAETKPKETRGRGRPAGSKSGARN